MTGDIQLDIDSDPDEVNAFVNKCALRDDWVFETFGVSGPGEGIVMYPVTINGNPVKYLHEAFTYKAKVDGHQVKTQKKPAQVATANPETIEAFVQMFVTPARCTQCVSWHRAEKGKELSTKDFMLWICEDIRKESTDELAASGMSWESVVPHIKRASKIIILYIQLFL